MNDICNFIPPKSGHGNIEFFHFVYETGIRRFAQPLMHQNFYANLVFKGCGKLKADGKEYPLFSLS